LRELAGQHLLPVPALQSPPAPLPIPQESKPSTATFEPEEEYNPSGLTDYALGPMDDEDYRYLDHHAQWLCDPESETWHS
jgi:hypothetical protein